MANHSCPGNLWFKIDIQSTGQLLELAETDLCSPRQPYASNTTNKDIHEYNHSRMISVPSKSNPDVKLKLVVLIFKKSQDCALLR